MLAFLSRGLRLSCLLASGAAGLSPAMAVTLDPAAQQQQVMTPFAQSLMAEIGDQQVLLDFYAARGFAAYFTDTTPQAAQMRSILLGAFEGAPFHALATPRYNAQELRAAFNALRSENDRARLEVRLAKALLDYARDLHSGVIVNPKRIDPMIVRDLPRPVPAEVLANFQANPGATLRDLAPKNPEYARLARARAEWQQIVAQGGWGAAITAKSLKRGATGPQVEALRARLQAMGYAAGAGQTFDAELEEAVRAFQAAQGLNADGAAGAQTLKAINTSAESRLRSITVAMERERWSNIPRGDRHIWVNLADFTAQILDDGKLTFETRAVIGSTNDDKRTPEFSHKMTYLEINPDWTVPPGIVRRDYLPRLQSNPGALGHLQVVDSRGRVIPRDQINFGAYTPNNFPFMLRQPPGPTNSLGRVKFMFPNPWAIYLHDTPDKNLFHRDARAFSAGCVRLQQPFDFAYELLKPQEANPKAAFHRALDSGKQTRINLNPPVPVHLDYRTAFTDPQGRVHFRGDIYGRDALIYEALVKAGVDG